MTGYLEHQAASAPKQSLQLYAELSGARRGAGGRRARRAPAGSASAPVSPEPRLRRPSSGRSKGSDHTARHGEPIREVADGRGWCYRVPFGRKRRHRREPHGHDVGGADVPAPARALRYAAREEDFLNVFGAGVALVVIGTVSYALGEGWNVIDALYFAGGDADYDERFGPRSRARRRLDEALHGLLPADRHRDPGRNPPSARTRVRDGPSTRASGEGSGKGTAAAKGESEEAAPQ